MQLRTLGVVIAMGSFAMSGLAQPLNGNLVANLLTISPSSPTSGQSITLTWSVSSFGIAGGRGQVSSYEILRDGTVVATRPNVLRTINNGSTSNFSDSVTVPMVSSPTAYQYSIRIFGDTGFNQADNTTSRFVTVSPPQLPDLVCVPLNANWSGPIVVSNVQGTTQSVLTLPFGSPAFADFNFRNTGGAMNQAGPGVQVEFLLDGVSLGVFGPAVPLGANEDRPRLDVALPQNLLTPGIRRLTLRLDAINSIVEVSDANNTAILDFVVSEPPRPNIQFDPTVRINPAVLVSNIPNATTPVLQFNQGDTAYVSVQYKNGGTLLSAPFDVRLSLNNQVIGSIRSTGLDANESQTRVDAFVVTNLPAGPASFLVTLDPFNEIVESNESDNTRAVNAAVAAATCPSVTSQPVSQSTCGTQSVTYSVAASGTSVLNYRWEWRRTGTTLWQTLVNGINSEAGQPVIAAQNTTSTTVSVRASVNIRPDVEVRAVVTNLCGSASSDIARFTVSACDCVDFNNNSVFPEDQDVIDFFDVLAGGSCTACNNIDFNNNGVFPEDQDIIDFFRVLAGGTC